MQPHVPCGAVRPQPLDDERARLRDDADVADEDEDHQYDQHDRDQRFQNGGKVWSARSASGAPLPAGTRVVVREIRGVRLIVAPAEEERSI